MSERDGRAAPDQDQTHRLSDSTAMLSEDTMTAPGEPPPASGAPILAAGAVLAGRFEIVRLIGRGGMGEVYEARDLELRETIALKTIRADVARNPRELDYFRREIQLARKVTHPNVCRIFDLFHHTEESGRDIAFLTMELLAGETLADRVHRTGRVASDAARPLAQQMAEALAAAHRVGVVHRDFKSLNVMLVPAAAEPGGVRAVVTDFGLARLHTEGPGAALVTRAGRIVGTPAYMAPEQVEGGTVGPPADLFALGVVLYEMLTGELPFVGESALSTAVKRLTTPALSPRLLVPELDPEWESVVMRCLERRPEDRFGSAAELARIIAGEATASLSRTELGVRRRRRRWVAALAAALVVSAAVLALLWSRLRPPTPGAAAARPAVAVLGFKNLTGRAESAWLSTALSEMLATELAAGERLRTVSGESVARAKLDLGIGESDTLAAETLTRLRKLLGADYVVLGSYVQLPGPVGHPLRLDLRLQDARAGETVASLGETGSEEQLFELVGRAGANLRGKLGAGGAAAVGPSASGLPASPEAARLYAEGLASLRLFDAATARGRLEKAIELDPQSAQARSALAAAYAALGQDGLERAAAQAAFERREGLAREERLLVEGQHWEAERDWERAVATYQALTRFFPDNLDYGLRLSRAQIAGGHGREALATIQALAQTPAVAPDDPRLHLVIAEAQGTLSEFREQLAAAERALAGGEELGARLLVARARLEQASALRNLGRRAEAVAAAEQARAAFEIAGDRSAAATALSSLGRLLAQSGDLTAAQQRFEEARATYEELGNQRGVADALHSLAIVRYNRGDLVGARELYARARAAFEVLGDRHGAAMVANNLAVVLRNQGDLVGARQLYEQARAAFHDVGDRSAEARAGSNIARILVQQGDLAAAQDLYANALVAFTAIGDQSGAAGTRTNLSDLQLQRGDLAGAEKGYEEALSTYRQIDEKASAARCLGSLGNVRRERGDVAGARQRLEESRTVRAELGDRLGEAEARLALAELALDERRPAEAATAARGVAATFAAAGAGEGEAWAWLIVGQALLDAGDRDGARAALARAAPLAARGNDRSLRLGAAIEAARLRAAEGKAAPAVAALEAAASEAHAAGFYGLELEARLAAAEIEPATPSARERAQALEREAAAKGFARIAARVRARLAA